VHSFFKFTKPGANPRVFVKGLYELLGNQLIEPFGHCAVIRRTDNTASVFTGYFPEIYINRSALYRNLNIFLKWIINVFFMLFVFAAYSGVHVLTVHMINKFIPGFWWCPCFSSF
jgi:hypothetical protein